MQCQSSEAPAVSKSSNVVSEPSMASPEPCEPQHEKLRDRTAVLIRPIQAADEALKREFIGRLLEQSRRYRFLGTREEPEPAIAATVYPPAGDTWHRLHCAAWRRSADPRNRRQPRHAGIARMYSIDANNNQRMREFTGYLGFQRTVDADDPTMVIHTLDLKTPVA
jgi:hypothetical protein